MTCVALLQEMRERGLSTSTVNHPAVIIAVSRTTTWVF